jgi:hypothetical protein
MIPEVDAALRELVIRDVLHGSNVDVSFDAPTTEWASKRQKPTLNLYLYDIREDMDRRRVQFEERRDAEGRVVERRQPPRKFKLSYLITAWTKLPEDEHRVLSEALATFLSFDALPTEVLPEALAALGEDLRVTVGLPPPQDRAISDIWSALGGELKPSLDLVVTTPVPARTSREQVVGPIVTEEPRIGFLGVEGELEVVGGGAGAMAGGRSGRSARNGKGSAGEGPGAEVALAEETVDAGKRPDDGGDGKGRRFLIKEIPRP